MLQRVHLIAASCRTAMVSRQPATVSAGWQQTALPHLTAGLGEAQAGRVWQSAGMPRLQQQRTVAASAAAAAGGRRGGRGDRYAGLSSQQSGTAARRGPGQTQHSGTGTSSGGSGGSDRAAPLRIEPPVLDSRLWVMRLLPVQQFKAVGVSFDDRQDLIPQLHKGEQLLPPPRCFDSPCIDVPAQLCCPALPAAAPTAVNRRSRLPRLPHLRCPRLPALPVAACLPAEQAVALVREPSNPHDPKAVAIRTLDGRSLGYIARDHTQHFLQVGQWRAGWAGGVSRLGGGAGTSAGRLVRGKSVLHSRGLCAGDQARHIKLQLGLKRSCPPATTCTPAGAVLWSSGQRGAAGRGGAVGVQCKACLACRCLCL